MNEPLPPHADAWLEMYRTQDMSNEVVRAVFRKICYVPAWEARCGLTFREIRMLKNFGHALELAYFTPENWSIMWVSALMLIAKYELLKK